MSKVSNLGAGLYPLLAASKPDKAKDVTEDTS